MNKLSQQPRANVIMCYHENVEFKELKQQHLLIATPCESQELTVTIPWADST